MLRSGRVCGGRHPAAECADKRRITVEQAAEVAPEPVPEPVIAVAEAPRPSSVLDFAAEEASAKLCILGKTVVLGRAGCASLAVSGKVKGHAQAEAH